MMWGLIVLSALLFILIFGVLAVIVYLKDEMNQFEKLSEEAKRRYREELQGGRNDLGEY